MVETSESALRPTAGGPAAIRGFRLQVLYALDLLLGGTERLRLEGVEDIDVLGPSGELVEAIQVKAYSTPLTLSTLKSRSGETSFFARLALLRERDRATAGVVVSFGPVGPELQGALTGDVEKRDSVVGKLEQDYGIANADDLVRCVRLDEQGEANLSRRLEERLLGRCPAASTATCIQLLGSWLLLCAERQSSVAQSDLEDQLLAAGEFAAACRAYADEWFRTIVPLVEADDCVREPLANEFHQGIAARFEHIVAGVDVLRPTVLDAIEDAYRTCRVVVLHGASGEGKSTLLFRFARDRCSQRLRFLVDVDVDLARTLAIANAISSYARHARSEVQLLLDVRPGNRHWRPLVESLASAPNVRILVGVREEDWLEGYALSYRVQLRDVPVRLEAAEAEQIFGELQRTAAAETFVAFDDAWTSFGGAGPLLEFVHLVTRHQSLKSRLQEQVGRLLVNLSEAAARLVRLAACATGFAGRVSVVGLVAATGLGVTEANALIRRLEEEYFLRRSPTGEWLEPVHPIRSRILCDLLFDATLAPLRKALVDVLPLVHDDDLERLLFESLLFDAPNDFLVSVAAASEQRVRWSAFAGIVRALLWLELSTYVDQMGALVAAAKKIMPGAWSLFLPWAFAPGWTDEFVESLAETRRILLQRDPLRYELVEVLAKSIPPVDYTRLRSLLEAGWSRIQAPSGADDWIAIGEVAYWHRYLRATASSPLNTLGDDVAIPSTLPLQHQLELVSADRYRGRWQWGEVYRRFVERYRIVLIEDGHDSLDATILIGARAAQELLLHGSEALNARAVNVSSGLHALVPNRRGYGCVGVAWPRSLLKHNDVHKHGMKGNLLQSKWGRRVLPVVIQMFEREGFPATWKDHAEEVVRFRVGFRGFMQALLQRFAVAPSWNGEWDEMAWNELDLRWCERSPSIPRCARDPWAVGTLEWVDDRDDKVAWYPQRYVKYERFLRDFHTSAVSLVYAFRPGKPVDDWRVVLSRAVGCWERVVDSERNDVAPLRPWWPDEERNAHRQVERAFLAELLVFLDSRRTGADLRPVSQRIDDIERLLGDIAEGISAQGCAARVDFDWRREERTPAIVLALNDPARADDQVEAAKRVCWQLATAKRALMETDFQTALESISLVVAVHDVALNVCRLSMLSVVVGNEEGFAATSLGAIDAEEARRRGLRVLPSNPVGEAFSKFEWAALALDDLLGSMLPTWNQQVTDTVASELVVDVRNAVEELRQLASRRESRTEAVTKTEEACEAILAADHIGMLPLLSQLVDPGKQWAVESAFTEAAALQSAQ